MKKLVVHIYEDEAEMDEAEYLLQDPEHRARLLKPVEEVREGNPGKSYTSDEARQMFLNEPGE